MKNYWNLFILIILLTPLSAFAAPTLPCQFYGTVIQDGVAVADGLVVAVKIDGEVVDESVTVGGEFGLNPDLLIISKEDSDWDGEVASFFVDGTSTGETYTITASELVEINISLPDTVVPVTPPSSGGGGGGGGGNYYVPTTPEDTASPADSNGDEKVDILDFVVLMANWGEEDSGNKADFNGDGKVDILDFVSLMAHWSK